MRTRPPKPTAQKKVEGNLGRRALNSKEPEFTLAELLAPEWLEGYGRELFLKLAKELIDNKMLTVADVPLFAAWCYEYGRYAKAAQVMNGFEKRDPATLGILIKSGGFKKKNKAGEVVDMGSKVYLNPLRKEMKAAFENVLKGAREFGFSPSSRVGVEAGVPGGGSDKTNPFAEFTRH